MRNSKLPIEYWPNRTYSVDRIFNPNRIKVEIGKYTSIGYSLKILTSVHPRGLVSNYPFFEMIHWPDYPKCTQKEPVIIGSDVWIGAYVTIVDAVTIGHGAIIGGCTVIAKNIPPYAIAVGNPPMIIGYRFGHNNVQALLKIKWWDWPDELVDARKQDFLLPVEKFIEKYV